MKPGLRGIGEKGPEFIVLPKGTQILSAAETRRLAERRKGKR